MRQSSLVYRTYKEWPKDEESKNARLLLRAGYIEKVASGIYNFLPLGLLVLEKITKIIRNHLKKIGAQELLLTNLHPKELWEKTGRWQSFDALFKTQSRLEKEYALAPTHEEIVFPLMRNIIQSYRDLPRAVYQIHVKFRDELRAKSGILRTKEFIMKDLYSFHQNKKDLSDYKNLVDETYLKIFADCGLKAILTQAGGGTFSEFSTEFQVITNAGEDEIYYCHNCQKAYNSEIFNGDFCLNCGGEVEKFKGAEVGNTFELSDKFAEAFDLYFIDQNGERKLVKTGCYGIGVTRVMGVVAEVYGDEYLLWPKSISPFTCHLLILLEDEDEKLTEEINEFEKRLEKIGKEVLIDDRKDVSFGEKLVESDLLGIPLKIIIGKRYRDSREVEVIDKMNKRTVYMNFSHLFEFISTHA